MAIQNQILDLVQLCSQKGIEQVVICPGSRNAPLTIAFSSHPNFKCYSISDERSAAYIALGMAQESSKTVVLICTSGTAAINFAPAIAEAYFLEIPLLILTADRPQQWINQYDGQTVFQDNLYGKNIKKSFNLVSEKNSEEIEWYFNRIVNDSINICQEKPLGPVHINIPIAEPFYPNPLEEIAFRDVRVVQNFAQSKSINKLEALKLLDILNNSKNIVVIVGQQFDLELSAELEKFSKKLDAIIINEKTSNVNLENLITESEIILKNNLEPLEIDLLITIGMSTVSKRIKNYFRNNKAKFHWHIQENTKVMDPFMSLTHKINLEPKTFFSEILESISNKDIPENNFALQIRKVNINALGTKTKYLEKSEHSDLKFLFEFQKEIKENVIIHLGNSLTVRYYNYLPDNQFVKKYYSNRGTSGIDGILSSALGQSINSEIKTICILGDVSFQYDKNALWNQYLPKNFKIVVLNNSGGNIFRMIDGPKNQKAHDEFFQTIQNNKANLIAQEYRLNYFVIKDSSEYFLINDFLNADDKASILEIFTNPEANESVLKEIK